jgi:hypothetical protein
MVELVTGFSSRPAIVIVSMVPSGIEVKTENFAGKVSILYGDAVCPRARPMLSRPGKLISCAVSACTAALLDEALNHPALQPVPGCWQSLT